MVHICVLRMGCSHFCPFCWFSNAPSPQSPQDDIDMCFSLPPNRPHSCLLSSYSGRHSSDVTGAKAVGWLPVSDGKLLLMSLGSLPRFGIIGLKKKEGRVAGGCVQKGGPFQPCVIVVSVFAVIFTAPSPPLFPHTPSISYSPSFSPSHPPFPSPLSAYHPGRRSDDHPELRSKALINNQRSRWILTA